MSRPLRWCSPRRTAPQGAGRCQSPRRSAHFSTCRRDVGRTLAAGRCQPRNRPGASSLVMRGFRYGAAQADASLVQRLALRLGPTILTVHKAERSRTVDLFKGLLEQAAALQHKAQAVDDVLHVTAHELAVQGILTRLQVLNDGLTIERRRAWRVRLLTTTCLRHMVGGGMETTRNLSVPRTHFLVEAFDGLGSRGQDVLHGILEEGSDVASTKTCQLEEDHAAATVGVGAVLVRRPALGLIEVGCGPVIHRGADVAGVPIEDARVAAIDGPRCRAPRVLLGREHADRRAGARLPVDQQLELTLTPPTQAEGLNVDQRSRMATQGTGHGPGRWKLR